MAGIATALHPDRRRRRLRYRLPRTGKVPNGPWCCRPPRLHGPSSTRMCEWPAVMRTLLSLISGCWASSSRAVGRSATRACARRHCSGRSGQPAGNGNDATFETCSHEGPRLPAMEAGVP